MFLKRSTNHPKPPIQPCLPKKNAGRLGLNWLYTKLVLSIIEGYYRLTTNWHRSTFVERPLQINLSACKTKPIYWILKMNVNKVLTKDYEDEPRIINLLSIVFDYCSYKPSRNCGFL